MKGGLLQGLGFLVVVDLARGYELVERLVGILCNYRVDFLRSVLEERVFSILPIPDAGSSTQAYQFLVDVTDIPAYTYCQPSIPSSRQSPLTA